MAFIGGISGEIYRQFALTIAVSVLLSAFSALSLSPALARCCCGRTRRPHRWLSRPFDVVQPRVRLDHQPLSLRRGRCSSAARRCRVLVLVAVSLLTGGLFKRLPAGFLPDEDQGAFFVSVRLPDGASTERTDAAARKIEKVIGKLPGVDKYFVLGGLDIATGTSNSNVATVIATLKPWEERKSEGDAARRDSRPGASAASRRCRRPSPSPSACRRFWA